MHSLIELPKDIAFTDVGSKRNRVYLACFKIL